jgi:hypothetical protein
MLLDEIAPTTGGEDEEGKEDSGASCSGIKFLIRTKNVTPVGFWRDDERPPLNWVA